MILKFFPLYVKSENGTIAEISSLNDGKIVKNGRDCDWKIGETTSSLMILLENGFKLIENPDFLRDNIIKIEKWLCVNNVHDRVNTPIYWTCETSDIDNKIKNLDCKKVKLLDSYVVKIKDKNES